MTITTRFCMAVLFCLAAVVLAVSPVLADPNCKAREEVLERKIAAAKSRGNARQAEGLERALANVRQYCTDGSLRGKAEMKLQEKREEVLEREADLEEARAQGDAKTIAKREEKLAKARAKAAEAEKELEALLP